MQRPESHRSLAANMLATQRNELRLDKPVMTSSGVDRPIAGNQHHGRLSGGNQENPSNRNGDRVTHRPNARTERQPPTETVERAMHLRTSAQRRTEKRGGCSLQ